MSLDVNRSVDSDQARQCKVDEMSADHGPNWRQQFAPGSFGCHEILDRVARSAEQIERDILDHPACIANAEWYNLADEAATALHELYQRIGAIHLGCDDDRPPSSNA